MISFNLHNLSIRGVTAIIITVASALLCSLNSGAFPRVPHATVMMGYSAATLYEIGVKALEKDSIDDALQAFVILAEKYSKKGDRKERQMAVEAINLIGVINQIYGNDYVGAYENFAQALDLCKDTEYDTYRPNILLNLGNLYNLYDFLFHEDAVSTEGRKLYKETFDLALSVENWKMVCASYINLCMLDCPFRIDESTNSLMTTLLKERIPHDIPDYTLSCQLAEGTGYILKKNYDKAVKVFSEMQDSLIAEKASPRDVYMSYICMQATYLHADAVHDAITWAEKTLKLKSSQTLLDVYMEAYYLLSRYYGMLGDKAKKQEYTILYYEAKNDLMRGIVEIKPTSISLELDKVKKEAADIIQAKHRQTVILIVVALFLIAATTVALIIFRKNKDLALKNRVLYDKMQIAISQETTGKKQPEDERKYKSSSLNETTRNEIIGKIKGILTDPEIITSPKFTLHSLAEMIGTNTAYLSQAINEHYGISFATLINQLRVKECCKRMADKETYGNLTIDAIREEVGFKTRSTFTNAFKQTVGMLPSEYLKLLRSGTPMSTD